MSNTAGEERREALQNWRSINVIKHGEPLRFKCGHLGTMGTPRKELCASCALEAKGKKR